MKKVISIEGMSCEHCVRRVEKALKEIDGITEVEVTLAENKAVIVSTVDIDDKVLSGAIDDAGYDVTSISEF